MTKPRDTREHRDDCKSFVNFAVGNCTVPNGKIYCPCKICRLNQRHLPSVVHAYLTGRKTYFLHIRTRCFMVRSLCRVMLNRLLRIVRPQMQQMETVISVEICTLCCVMCLTCMMSRKTTMSLRPLCKVMKKS